MEDTGVILPVYVTTFILGLPANIVALYAFIRKARQGAAPVDVLLIGLTTSDLLFLIFLPLWMKAVVDNMKWEMAHFLCPLAGLIFYGTMYNSSFPSLAISVERYLAVAFPVKYKLNRKPCYAVVGSIIIWTISMAECSIVYFMHYYDNSHVHVGGHVHDHIDDHVHDHEHDHNTTEVEDCTYCFDNFNSEQLKVLLPFRLQVCVVLFCVPLVICCFCYINFIRILSRLPNICTKRRRRAIGLALGTMVIFAVCYGPHNVSHVVGFITGESPGWRKHAVLTSTFNTCLNPFIYYFSSSAFRATFRGMFHRLSARLPRREYQGTVKRPAVELEEDTRTQSTNDNLG
ncbi:free fatty acid receptor 2-like [Engraulis encrasicolus]|uniref:free fatty acid receptor 2-like n=1 Tax=Engraulis encrasicolus TaxID=184585 RepID=UPI002FD12A33